MNGEKKEREITFKMENVADRIIALVILGIIGGPGIVSMVVPSARPLAFTSEDWENGSEQIMKDMKARDSALQFQIDDTKKGLSNQETKYYNHVINGHPDSVKQAVNKNTDDINEIRKQLNYYFKDHKH